MPLHSEMTSVTFRAKTKKMQTVVRSWSKDGMTADYKAVTKTLTQTQFQVDPDTRKPIRHLHAQLNDSTTTLEQHSKDLDFKMSVIND